jgi:hypothetical protein
MSTWPHGIAPNLTLRLLAVGERLLTTTSRRAARSLHQHGDQGRAAREFDV